MHQAAGCSALPDALPLPVSLAVPLALLSQTTRISEKSPSSLVYTECVAGTELETDSIKRKAPPKKSPAKKTAAKKKRRTKEDEEEDEEGEEEESEEEAEEEKEAAEEKEEEEAAEEEHEEAEVGKFLRHHWVGTQKGMELQYDFQWASGTV